MLDRLAAASNARQGDPQPLLSHGPVRTPIEVEQPNFHVPIMRLGPRRETAPLDRTGLPAPSLTDTAHMARIGDAAGADKEVVAEFDRAVDEGDVDALGAVCHPHMVTHSFGPSMPQGLDGMRKFVSERSSSGASGRWTHVVTVAEGEYVIAYGTRIHHWPGGQFRGFDVPAGTITRDSAFMFRVKDGRITDRWAIRDDLAMMAQLGAVQPPRPEEVPHGTVTAWRDNPFD